MSLQHNESVHSASITKSCWEEMNTHAEISSLVDILSVTPRPTFARNITKWWTSIHVSGDHMLFRISYSLSVSSVSGTACFRHVSSSMVINHNFRQNTSVEKKKNTFSILLSVVLFAVWHPYKNSCSKKGFIKHPLCSRIPKLPLV